MENSVLKRFGNNVKRLRKNQGWSQEELAKKSGLHRTYIGSLENGGRNVSLINVERLAKALHVDIESLLR